VHIGHMEEMKVCEVMKMTAFRDITPCNLVEVTRFRWTQSSYDGGSTHL
jgi:hypothetical protein